MAGLHACKRQLERDTERERESCGRRRKRVGVGGGRHKLGALTDTTGSAFFGCFEGAWRISGLLFSPLRPV